MSNLKEGDIVRLRSGGPLMTITEIDGDTYGCMWFNDADKNKSRFERFPGCALKVVNEVKTGVKFLTEDM